ncbi:MAG: hypothetical protein HQK77_19050 [Desulfobacterales bacterium]|nr:hypothetical protein [Desulfobacterales bacterium]
MKLFLIIACLVFRPLSALGTAGFAEKHSQLNYNEWAVIHWIHPGDGCDSGKYCFYIEKMNPNYGNFKELYCSIQKINIPENKTIPLIFGQTNQLQRWFIYNLQTETYLIQTHDYDEALSYWKTKGLKEPKFSDASTGAKGLSKTWSSRFGDWLFTMILFLPVVVIIALPVFTFFSVKFIVKYRITRQKKYILLFIGLLIPTLLLWLLALVLFGFISIRTLW